VKVVSAVNGAKIKVVTVNIVSPVRRSHFAPNLSNSVPVTGFIKPMTMAPGNIASPEWKAENPSKFCIYKGKITVDEIIAPKTIIPSMVAKEKSRYEKTLNSKIGSSNWDWRRMNKKSVTAPTPPEIRTLVANQPTFPATLKAYNKPPKPKVDKIIDKESSFGFVRSVTFFKTK